MSFINTRRMRANWLAIAGLLAGASTALADFNLRMQTDLGAIDILMLDSVAPLTVANFMNYVNRGDYDGTFIHRSVPGFIVQGGGYTFDGVPGTFLSGGTTHIPEDPPVVNEFNLSNLRGTIAMAKLGSNPDSATSEFFFNLADNSANLDAQNGGFTVFAQVTGSGMGVVDAIAALPTCPTFAPFFVCSAAYASDLPVADSSGVFDQTTLINLFTGIDNDADGAIDRLEDAGPNSGDANNDLTPDSSQQFLASYPSGNGTYTLLETTPSTPLTKLSHRDASFRLANPGGAYDLLTLAESSGMSFMRGLSAFDINGITPGGAATATVTLPAGDTVDTYFMFGPTPQNPVPHWYEFLYDGTTGAQFVGNVVTLVFVDGLRGDADLDDNNGIIGVSPGGATLLPNDLDGVIDAVEDGAPNGGDGNMDATPDRLQSQVTSLPDINNNYITFEAMLPGQTLHYVEALNGSTLGLSQGPALLTGFNFEHGFFEAHVANVTPGGSAEIRVLLPSGALPDAYFMYGPEPGNPVDHWYRFDFDGTTGAVINGNSVTLYFVDGQRGDADLLANGIIADPGGPATAISNANTVSGGSGGCSLSGGTASIRHAGAWWLLLALLLVFRQVRHQRFLKPVAR